MLILRLREGKGAIIGRSIRIVARQVGKRLVIGIEAPRSVKVEREELLTAEELAEVRETAKRGHAREEFRG